MLRKQSFSIVLLTLTSGVLAAPAAAQTVEWIVPPPQVAVAGTRFFASWRINGFDGSGTTGIAWGVTSVIDTTVSQTVSPARGKVFEARVDVPLADQTGTLKYVAFLSAGGNTVGGPVNEVLIAPVPTNTGGPPPGGGSSILALDPIAELLLTPQGNTGSLLLEQFEAHRPLIEDTLQVGIQGRTLDEAKTWTPLHGMAAAGFLQGVNFLIGQGADVNAVSVEGLTPLHLAMLSEDVTVINALAAAGANVNAQDVGGNTPLHLASKEDETEAVNVLVALGANLNAPNLVGDTPLHVAAKEGAGGAALALLTAGAAPNLRNNLGLTPRGAAEANLEFGVAALIASFGGTL